MGEAREVGLVDVRKVLQRVVANDVASGFLRIVLPGLARDLDLARDVVDRDREAGRSLTVVVGEDLSGGQHKVVADRGMRIGEVLGGQAVLGDKRIEVGHAGTAHHRGIGVVLQRDDHDVSERRQSLPPSLRQTKQQEQNQWQQKPLYPSHVVSPYEFLENQQRALPAGLVRTTSEKDVEWKRRSGECKVRTPQHEIKSCRSGPKTTGLKSFPNGSLCSGAHRGVAGKAGAMVGPSAAKRCPQPEAAFPLKNAM